MTSSSGAQHRRHAQLTALTVAAALVLALLAALSGAQRADAVNADHAGRVVAEVPVAWTPHAMNGSVIAMVQVGNKMIAAGTFTSVSPAATFTNTGDDLVRNRIFAFDATTGQIDPGFNPNLNGAANSLATDGTSIYVAGKFGAVGGDTTKKRIVKLSLSGAVDPNFKAIPNKAVNEVVVHGSRVYIGGQFTKVKNGNQTANRTSMAALDPSTGAVLPDLNLTFSGVYDPTIGGKTAVKRFDVSPDGSRLVAVGNFTTVGNQSRANLVVLNTAGGTVTVAPWTTTRYSVQRSNCANAFDNPMRDVDISPDGTFFVVSTTGAFAGGAANGSLCDTTARWELDSTGNDPSWIGYTGGDTSYGVAITGGVVYVGGHFRWQNNPFQGDQAGPGAVPRSGVAALDARNGVPLSWNPGRARGVGAQAMYATPNGLWVGSDTKKFQGKTRGRIAFVPLAGGTALPATPAASFPNDLFMAGGSSAGSELRKRAVTSSGTPTTSPATVASGAEWSSVRGAFYLNGDLYYGVAGGTGTLMRRSFNPSTGALGTPTGVNLYNDPDNGTPTWSNLSTVSGMFFDPERHRLYYSISGNSTLRYRYFSPESRIVGAQEFTAGTLACAPEGMTLASNRIFFGCSNGTLRSVAFANGAPSGATSDVSTDGTWRLRAMFVPNG